MDYLADTNVVLRRVLGSDAAHQEVKAAVDALILRGDNVFITAQILIELQALATRPPTANGLGMSTAEASALATALEALFPLIPETPTIYPEWRSLINATDTQGRQVYDARLVAVMVANNISHLITLNPAHFRRFQQITVVEPKDINTGSENNTGLSP